MAETPRKGILNRIRKLVSETGRSIIWRSRPKDNDVSEKIAQKIQKNSYDYSLLKKTDTYTAPYLVLADQLQVDDDQIFRAAVHAIVNIANARSKYKQEIRDLLEQYLQQDNVSQPRRDYVRLKMFEISK